MTVSKEIEHHYKRYRKHQNDTYGDSGIYMNGKSLRQFTGGGACYGCHAIAAYLSAKSHIHFINNYRKKLKH